VGDPFRDVALDLVFPKDKPVFILNGKKLQLLEPLDRDDDNLSHIVFQVSAECNVQTPRTRCCEMWMQYSDKATGWTTGVRFPSGATMACFCPRRRVQTGSGSQPVS